MNHMQDEQRGRTPPPVPNEPSRAGPVPRDADDAGMANTLPPALPGTPAPLPPPPPTAGARGRLPPPAGMGGVRGVVPPGSGDATAAAGQDVRHRGWYWHWNTLVTQYAPLLGLKGVGLLNSYTVWTDRREGSPHQGYAFPSQEAEARFYGEQREELITLNKLLVALDLIEIHKEMVLRQDDRGRRWRVPHNFYRVKDPRDGLVLNIPAVVRVLELAQRDKNVFRQIRHIFGAQYAPIDRTSIWHYLLPELRLLPLWQTLAERAERERRGGKRLLSFPDAAVPTTDRETVVSNERTFVRPSREMSLPSLPADDDAPLATDNAVTDNAPSPPRTYAVRATDAETSVGAPFNLHRTSTADEGTTNVEDAAPAAVGATDSTEDQSGETQEATSTSTTSTSTRESVSDLFAALAARDADERAQSRAAWLARWRAQEVAPTGDAPPAAFSEQPLPPAPLLPEDGDVVVRALDVTEPNAAGLAQQAATIADIEAALTMANGRPPSDMEISLLVQVARECDPAAHAQGYGPGTGLGWVLAAIWEAVNSGSQFVAPKRVAAICDRWVAEGFGSDHRANPTPPPAVPPPTWPMPSLSEAPPEREPPAPSYHDSGAFPALTESGDLPALGEPVPEGEAQRLWDTVTRRLDGVLHPDALRRWFSGARVTHIARDRVTVTVADAEVALKLASYRGLISRRMSEAIGRTVDVVFHAAHLAAPSAPAPQIPAEQSTRVDESPPPEHGSPWWWPASGRSAAAPPARAAEPERHAVRDAPPPLSPPRTSGASARAGSAGPSNPHIWALALRELETQMNGASLAVWVRPAALIGTDPDGTLVIGAKNRTQRERLDGPYRPLIVRALRAATGNPAVGVRVAIIGETDAGAGEEQQSGD